MKTVWEENGISIEDYARAFNKVLDKAFQEQIKGKMYFVSTTKQRLVKRIVNIKIA